MLKRIQLLLFFCCVLNGIIYAQEKKIIQRLVPHHAKIQFAGGIGYLSAGAGYRSKNGELHYDILYGYVPKSKGGIPIHSLTAKFTWLPLSVETKNKIRLNIITTGILLNYSFGDQYFLFRHPAYPFDFYDFSTALYAGVFAGGEVSYKNVGLYYEWGTTDKRIINYIRNTKSVSFTGIFHLGIGLRWNMIRKVKNDAPLLP